MYYRSVVRGLLHLKMNPVVKIFIFADFLFFMAVQFLQPLFALFIVGRIPGANELTVAVATTVHLLMRVLPEIPIGVWLDRTKSQRDDHLTLVVGTILVAMVYLFYPPIQTEGQLYLVHGLAGFASALIYPSWRSIFTRYIDKQRVAFEWSIYDVLTGVGMALGSALGGLLVVKYGFNALFYSVSVLSLISAGMILSVRKQIR